ncbi:hypothetical protein QP854_23475, partial [Niallia taxi]
TRKLSFSAPMVVGGSPPVRVGRRQARKKASSTLLDAFLFFKLGAFAGHNEHFLTFGHRIYI